jgi:hypothetical protein
MIDFHSLRASLASDPVSLPRDDTSGRKGRSEGGVLPPFPSSYGFEVFLDDFGGVWAMESSPVTARGSVAVWEAKETMVMSMSSLETPLEADPVIQMLLLRCVPALQGSIWTWTPTNVARVVPIARFTCSCL